MLRSSPRLRNKAQVNPKPGPIPVTVLSGFLGSGKTTLLSHLLHNRSNQRIGVVVNDMAELNVDVNRVRAQSTLIDGKDMLVEMSNGCICCTLRPQFVESLTEIARKNSVDYIIIESTGISEPLPVAVALAEDDNLQTLVKLDTLVTVVDAETFLNDLESTQKAVERREMGAEKDDNRMIVDLLIDQIETANIILLNKVDRVKKHHMGTLRSIISHMNPTAEIRETTYSKVEPSFVLNSGRFNLDEARGMKFWSEETEELKNPSGSKLPESEEYGISSFVYRSDRPFDDDKIQDIIDEGLEGVIRSKGIVWMKNDPEKVTVWSHAGASMILEDGPSWEEEGNTPRQELVIIGVDMDTDSIRKTFDDALWNEAQKKKKKKRMC